MNSSVLWPLPLCQIMTVMSFSPFWRSCLLLRFSMILKRYWSFIFYSFYKFTRSISRIKDFLHKKMVFECLSFDPRLHHNLPQRLWQCALPNPQTVCIRLLPHAPQGSPVSCLEFLLTHAFISKLIRILKWNGLRISSRSKVGTQ